MVYVLYIDVKNLRQVSPQKRFTLKEFETTTRKIGLIIFQLLVIRLPDKPSCESLREFFSFQANS